MGKIFVLASNNFVNTSLGVIPYSFHMIIGYLKPAISCKKMLQSVVGSMQGSSKGCLLLKVVFQCRLSSTTGGLPPKVVFHQRSSSTKGHLPLKVVFHLSSSFTTGRLPSKVVIHQRSYGKLFPNALFGYNVKYPPLIMMYDNERGSERPGYYGKV